MNRVLDRLWLGCSRDLAAGAPLGALGFRAVVDLRDGRPAADLDVEVFRVENRDGDPWSPAQVNRVLDFIHDRIREGRVLIACDAGMSRSPSLAVGYLVRCGWDSPAAYERVREARGETHPRAAMLGAALAAAASASTKANGAANPAEAPFTDRHRAT